MTKNSVMLATPKIRRRVFRSLRSALETLRVNPLMLAIATLGNLTCLGLLLGYLNLRSTSFISASAVLLVSFSAALRLTGGVITSHEPRLRSNTDLIVPLLFLLAGCRWLFRPSEVRLSWLFRTWDGITNPGLVIYSKTTGNIGSDVSTLTQWETYPRAPHFALGQLSRVAEGLGYANTSHRLTIYVLGLWFTYSLVILGIGSVIKRAGDALKLNNRRTSVVSILAQLSVVVSGFLDKTLLLHSLSFLTCIAVCLSLIALWVDHVNDVELKWQQVLLGALHLVVIVETFPLIYVFVIVYFGLFFRRFVTSESFRDPLAVASLAIPIAIIGPRLLQQMRVATASNHVEAGGHLLGLSSTVLALTCLAIVLSIMILNFHSVFGRQLGLLLLGAAGVPISAWLMVGNFDRTYGVNYYPKKVEFFAFVLALAMAPLGLLLVVQRLRSHRKFQLMSRAFVCVATTVVFWTGPLKTPMLISNQDPARQYFSLALWSADQKSQTIIIGEDQWASIYSSMLTNFTNEEFWRLGYANDRLITTFQQLSTLGENVKPAELCSIMKNGPAQVLAVRRRHLTRVVCAP